MSWLKNHTEPRRQWKQTVLPIAAFLLNAALLWHFHDRSWYPPDDGNYAHVAERVARGEILNRDVQDIHAGYINFVNAAALRIFGPDLAEPAISGARSHPRAGDAPVLASGLAKRGRWHSSRASPERRLGVIQFFNPTAHWYCDALTLVLAVWMVRGSVKRRKRLIVAGALVGLVVLFRQLSGLWLGMGLLTVALSESADGATGSRALLSRMIVATMLVVLVLYAASTREWLGALLIATPSIGILVWMLGNVRTSNEATLAVMANLGAGATVPALPLLVYHVAHGSLGSWIGDVVGAAVGLTGLGFFGQPWYAAIAAAGLREVTSTLDPVRIVNGAYWVALPLLPLVNGIGIIRHLRATRAIGDQSFPVLVAFYSLVSLHFQIPIYLYYTVGLCLAAILWQNAFQPRLRRAAWMVGALALGCVGVIFHAAQPYTRTPIEILHGVRRSLPLVRGFERCSLQLDPTDREVFARLVAVIQREVPPEGELFAIPSDAELYFLANRRNPFRFYNTAIGIRSTEEFSAVMDALTSHPPAVVTYRPDDKYNTEASRAIMERIRATYDRLDPIGGFEVYRSRHRQ